MLIHPTGFTQPQRFSRFYFNNVIGNPLDTTLALHYLIFDGVFERHPKLRVLAMHGGGFLGAYSGRIDHAWGARSDATAICRSRRRLTCGGRSISIRSSSRRTSSKRW